MLVKNILLLLLELFEIVQSEHVAVIGGGLSGLTAACELRRIGYDVTLYEKRDTLGGRAGKFSVNGFTFDMGPSWYWMPEIYDKLYARFGHSASYNLTRLDPAYRVITSTSVIDIPGTTEKFIKWSNETKIKTFFDEASEKYDYLLKDWLWRPMQSVWDLLDPILLYSGLKFKMFGSLLKKQIQSHVSNDFVRLVLEWPVIFVGLSPYDAPVMWSFLSYSSTNTFYPNGGMTAPIKTLTEIASKQGVDVRVESEVTKLKFQGNRVAQVCTKMNCSKVLGVVAAGDYEHIEQQLMPHNLRRYDTQYWQQQILSPSCMLYYLAFNRSIPQLLHHTFFFDSDLDRHLEEMFVSHVVSENPTFYVSATSKTDKSVAPSDGETIFVLVPLTYTCDEDSDTPEFRRSILDMVLKRMFHTASPDSLIYNSSFGPSDFKNQFHAFRGNAFGHANTLLQSFFFKPSMYSKSSNMIFAGHMTHPGPGMPPSMVSGVLAAELLHKQLHRKAFWSILFLSCYIVFLLVRFVSIRFRSYFECCWYFYTGGRTYFAAATLMNTQRFLDTAAMYALFRAADECVDVEEDSADVRDKKLSTFEKKFWVCFEQGKGDYALHPILPAVIETTKRHKYPKELFEKFFHSMRMDVYENICAHKEDTYSYIEGSAAVIGDFMLPILQPDDKLRSDLTPHARDLGRAFQMTNFLRDISEDLDLGRQYIPEEVCKRHNVVLSEKDSTQTGWSDMMEEMFQYTEKFYDSADVGIAKLPSDIRGVIKIARKMYHRIHKKIRENEYDVFRGKLKVPFQEKVMIAAKELNIFQILRIVAVECLALFLWNARWLAVLAWTFASTTTIHMDSPTYLQFHLIFNLPVLILTFPSYSKVFKEVCLLSVIAVIWSTPLEQFLIYSSAWSHFDDRVIYFVGNIPIEECAFFVIASFIPCGVFMQVSEGIHLKSVPRTWSCQLNSALIWFFGSIAFIFGICIWPYHFYLANIICWSVPVIMFQWWYCPEVFFAYKWPLIKSVSAVTLFFSVTDHWALSHGIWRVDDVMFDVIPGLPFEEFLWYFVTSVMGLQGLMMILSTQLKLNNDTSSSVEKKKRS